MLRKIFQGLGLGQSLWLRIGQEAGSFECGNEPSGYTKCGEFLIT